jgi:hypothetical protein
LDLKKDPYKEMCVWQTNRLWVASLDLILFLELFM